MTTAIEQAQEIYASARAAKREESRQRRLARERMQELAAFCRRNGIELEIVKGADGGRHGRSERQH